jgi:hypothetical protein
MTSEKYRANLSRFARDISFKGDVRHGYKQNKQAAQAGNQVVVADALVSFIARAFDFGEIADTILVAEILYRSKGAHAQERDLAFPNEERSVTHPNENRVVAFPNRPEVTPDFFPHHHRLITVEEQCVEPAQIRAQGAQGSRDRDEASQARRTQEPKAGDRHRAFQGAPRGRQSATAAKGCVAAVAVRK